MNEPEKIYIKIAGDINIYDPDSYELEYMFLPYKDFVKYIRSDTVEKEIDEAVAVGMVNILNAVTAGGGMSKEDIIRDFDLKEYI